MAKLAIALTIAGSDSGGGAGIQADLKTFSALGVYGASVITAVTAQDTQRVYGFVELEPAFVAQQIDAVIGDIGADAVKTGMLSSARDHRGRRRAAAALGRHNLVVDPVMVAKGGDKLLRDDAVTALQEAPAAPGAGRDAEPAGGRGAGRPHAHELGRHQRSGARDLRAGASPTS